MDRDVFEAWRAQMGPAIDSLATVNFQMELPPSVEMKIGGRIWQLRPLADVVAAHPGVARVAERSRRRSASLPA